VIKFSRLTFAVALLASSATAQTRMGFAPRPRFGAISQNRIGIARGHRAFNPAYGYYGTPYFYSDYYQPSDFEYLPEPSPPPIQVQVKSEPLPDPVLLELHGSRWVKVTNFGESSDRTLAAERPAETQTITKPLPPAVLVYRDGHTEELSSYSIIGGSIHTKSNYWTTGAWTRTIPIADLDVPATLQLNEKRGVNFALPSGPDEVMLRP
jgi:hypothetical protein